MDYKELLKKYMNHVGEYEGYSFIPNSPYGNVTAEDIEELKKIEKQIDCNHDLFISRGGFKQCAICFETWGETLK